MTSRSSNPAGVLDDPHPANTASSTTESTPHRLSRILVVLILLSSITLSTVAVVATSTSASTARPPVDGNARIFVATDHDPKVLGAPGGGRGGILLRNVVDSGTSPAKLARAIDSYTLTTNPKTRIPIHGTQRTLQEYRLAQLASVHRTNSTSHWPASAPDRQSGQFIKDGFIAYMGATSGVQVKAPGARANDHYLMGTNGSVLEYVDYRVDLPSPSTTTHYVRNTKHVTLHIPAPANNSTNPEKTVSKTVSFQTLDGHTITRTVSVTGRGPKTVHRTVTVVVGGHRTITRYHLTRQSVDRHLSIGGQTWSKYTTPKTAPRDARHINYSNAKPSSGGSQRLQLKATIHMNARIAHRHYFYHPVNHTWTYTHTVNDTTGDSLTVSDHRQVDVVPPDSVSITQRVITEPYGHHTLVLTIHGPKYLSQRSLWSWAAFTADSKTSTSTSTASSASGQLLTNVWQVYSVRQYRWGEVTSNRNTHPRRTGFPPTLALHLSARQSSPGVALAGNSAGETMARVTNTSQQTVPGVSKPASLEDAVNLSTATANETTMVVIKDAPGRLTSATTIFGNHIPIRTTHVASRKTSSLSYTTVSAKDSNGNDPAKLKLRLTGPNGHPLSNRELFLTGATKNSVTTNNNGVAYATFDSPTITARFPGDPYTENRDVYYASTSATAVAPGNGNLISGLWSYLFLPGEAALLSLAVIVGLFIGVVWYVVK